jgi:diguanylate cyclase (GGDEF)-like protein
MPMTATHTPKAANEPISGWGTILRALGEVESGVRQSTTKTEDSAKAVEAIEPGRADTPSGFYLLTPPEPSGLRVLLLLEPELLRSTKRKLRLFLPGRASLHAVASVDEALSSLRARDFDVLVTSANCPNDPSIQRLAPVAAAYGEVPIVVVGEDASLETAASFCRSGVHEYLVREELGERGLARAVVCAYERARRTQRLIDDAHQDELTQVANRKPLRARFHEMRYRALRSGGDLACLVVDLDGFKRINDTFGHHVGDEVLAAVAARLLAHVRATDFVARIGGDEFAVLLDRAEQRAYGEIVERLERVLAEPLAIDGYLVPISASVGLGTGAAEEATDLGELLKRADADMYRKKSCAVAAGKAGRAPA